MADNNPFDALDDQPAGSPTSSGANPFDALDEAPAQDRTASHMQAVTDQAQPTSEVTVSARRPGRESTWSELATAASTDIGAGIEKKVGGAQEFIGHTAYDDARKKFWQATILPDAVRNAKAQNVTLGELPEVQDTARHLGIRPDVFTRDWPTYVNQSDDELNAFKSQQRDRIQTGAQQIASGTRRRMSAQEVQEAYAPRMDDSWLKHVVFDAATMTPDVLAGVGGTIATGGVGGAAIMAADIAPNMYAEARSRGLDHNDASTYAVLSTVASSVPEIPVLKIVQNTPLARKVIGSVVGEKLASTGVGKVAGTVAAQGVTQSVVNALQQGIDAGVLNEHLPLDEALKQVAWSGLVGAVVGAPMGAYHAATSRAPKPTTFRDIPEVGGGAGEPALEASPGGAAAAEANPEEGSAPSMAPTSVSPDEPEHKGTVSPTLVDNSEGEKAPADQKNIFGPEAEHAALRAMRDGTVTPPQAEQLEKAGFIKRNDLGEPVMLPIGRRRLAALDKEFAAPAQEPEPPGQVVEKEDKTGPLEPQNEPKTPIPAEEGQKQAPKSAEMEETAPEVPKKALEAPSERLLALQKRLSEDEDLRNGLTAMKGETGWQQVGGKLLRDATTDEVTGRTSWIPNAEWWPGRPNGLKEEEIHTAIDKAVSGQPLKKRELDMVEYMAQVHGERVAMGKTRQELEEAVPDLSEQPPDQVDLTMLAERAGFHDVDATMKVIDSWQDDHPETIARVRGEFERIIGRGQQQQQEGGGFELSSQEGRAREPAQAPRSPAALDLFGEDRTREQALADETRRRDALRSPNRDVPLETGLPGDVFSQSRRQVDLEDVAKKPKERPTEVTFRTAKGSTYVVDEQGRTTRNKAARPEHPGDEGPQPKSEATYYVTKADANKLGEFQAKGPHPKSIIQFADGRIGMRYEGGPHKFKIEHRTVVEFKKGPAKGLIPVETWEGGKRVHFGNEITHVEGPTGQDNFLDALDAAREQTHTEPTEAQKAAGNYKKGRLDFGGMQVAIENPKGSIRTGRNSDGTRWKRKMAHDYGYIAGSEGKDGDAVDVFLAGKPDTGKVYVVNQVSPLTGKFDEHKAVLGASSEEEARQVYEANYPKGWKGEESIAELSTRDFRDWVHSGGPAKGPIRPPSKLERRTETARRSKISEMTPEELRKELLTHELTGIPNRRAYHEAEKLEHQVSIDVDSLKWVNDNMGHESGNELLKAVAASLSSHSDNVFHLSGDEFAAQSHTETEAHELMRQVAEHLQNARIEIEMPDGRVVSLKGLGVSYGVGKTIEEADAALSAHKARRQAEGQRAERGQAPPGASIGAREEGRQDKEGGPPEIVEVKENAAKYSNGLLLHPSGRVEAGAHREVAPGQGSLDFFAPASNPVPTTRAARALAATRLVQTGHIATGIKRVTKWQDAAHIVAPLRKLPQESMLAVVTDHAGNVLSVIRHTTGTATASYVHPATLVGAIARVPGAEEVWFAHNHPSGDLQQSPEDHAITRRLHELMRSSGITPRGMIVVGPGTTRATHYIASTGEEYGQVSRAARRGRVPIQERRYQSVKGATDGVHIQTTQDVERLVASLHDESGVVLLDSKLRVLGHISVPYEEMGKLRTGVTDSGTARILSEVEKANTVSAIVYGDRKKANDLANIGQMLHVAGINMTDTVTRGETGHWDSNGKGLIRGQGQPFFRRGEATQGLERGHVERIVHGAVREANIQSGFPHVEVHQDIDTLPAHIRDLVEQQHAQDTTGAVYDPNTGRIHLIADNNGSEQEVRENLWHEAVGHHGLRLAMDRPQYNAIMDGIARDMPERVEAAARRNGLDLTNLDQKRAASEEVVAYAAGQLLSGQPIAAPFVPVWKRVVRAVRSFFARMTGKPFYDEKAIAGLVQQSHQALERGSVGSTPGEPMRSTRAPMFYSAVERAIEGNKQGKASGEQWLATIQRTQGVKPDELEWLDLKHWLKGQKSVTRDDLLDYVRANHLELHETDNVDEPRRDQRAEYVRFDDADNERTRIAEELRSQGHEVRFNEDGTLESFEYNRGQGIPEVFFPDVPEHMANLPQHFRSQIERLQEVSRTAADAMAHLDLSEEGDGGTAAYRTRYGQYTLPGGENYHELLLKLPTDPYRPYQLPARKAIFDEYAPRLKALADELNANRSTWTAQQQRANILEHDRLSRERDKRADAAAPAAKGYLSPHWQDPNVLAHVRFKDRTDAQGRKILHVEEIQSDWHQKGRERGYVSDVTPEQRAEAQEIERRIDRINTSGPTDEELADYFKPGAIVPGYGGWDRVIAFHPSNRALPWRVEVIRTRANGDDIPGASIRSHSTSPSSEMIRELRHRLALIGPENRVPDAPFKTSWPMLVMKRMIRLAAENGHDRISWTTGKQQAERYNLAQHIDSITYSRDKDGKYWLYVEKKDGNPAAADLQRNGMTKQQVAEYVGQDLADKMERGEGQSQSIDPDEKYPERKLSALDLEVGGEGMKGFYDDILPRETGKLIKKYGSRVEDASVHTDLPDNAEAAAMDLARVPQPDRANYWAMLGPDERESLIARTGLKPQTVAAHGFDITPEMRQAALGEGFPLFSRRQQPLPLEENRERGPYALIRRAVNAVHDSKVVRDVRKLANPVGMSPESKQTAQIARAALGELAHETVKTQEALEAFSRQVDRMPIQDQLEMMDAIERGTEQPHPELQPVADEMRRTLDTWRDKVRGLGEGYLDNFIENYFPHYWRDQSEAQRMVASIMGRRPLRGPASFLKMRTIPSIKEGMEAGLTPLTTNPLVMTLLKAREMQRFVTGVTLMRRFKEDGLARFLRSGLPMPEGWGPINDNIAKVRQWSEAEGGFIDRGQYIMPLEAARVINNHVSASALRDFAPAQIIRRGANALNAMQLGFSAFHLGFTTLDAMISKNAQGIERMLHGDVLGAAKSFGEGVTPIGAVRNVMRGYRLLHAYTNPAGATPEMQKLVQALEQGGGRAHMDRYYLATEGFTPFRGVGIRSLASDVKQALTAPQDKLERLGQALGSFPAEYANKLWRGMQEIFQTTPKLEVPVEMAMRVVRASTSWIMEHLVPMQKLGVFSDLAADHLARNPVEDPNERAAAMQRIWDSVDNRLGEMVYDNVFWNRTLKDSLHLAIRAVGWNLGTVREIGGAPIDLVKAIDKKIRTGELSAADLGHRIPYVLSMVATTALYAAVYQYMATGKGPQELKDYFFPRTGGVTNYGTPQRVSLPSYIKDVYEYSQRPGTTVVNKLNPIFSLIGNLYSNEDFFGNPITDPEAGYWQQKLQQLRFVGKEATPFSFQGRQQMKETDQGEGLGATVKKVLPMVGVTPAPGYITSGEQMERRKRLEDDQKYTKELKYQMRKAAEGGDKAKAADLAKQYVDSVKRMNQTQKLVEQDRAKAAAARRKAATTMRDQGFPATANLVASLPLEPDEAAREYFAQQAAA